MAVTVQLDPVTTALLTVECQQGVVGEDSALPELAAQARSSGALFRIARLVAGAHEAGVQVLHAVAERRPDGRGANHNALLRNLGCRTLVVTGVSANVAIPTPSSTRSTSVIRRWFPRTPSRGCPPTTPPR